jgi:hypothetical protein
MGMISSNSPGSWMLFNEDNLISNNLKKIPKPEKNDELEPLPVFFFQRE